ncbi:olfactory receptor 6N1-like [Dendropsophus ebraccatus]|uniref:olfactory receptor 6N1-like n=1 Tax=Dendropsophus ebraccatus TaxID=150705 RepID=UPI00383141F4
MHCKAPLKKGLARDNLNPHRGQEEFTEQESMHNRAKELGTDPDRAKLRLPMNSVSQRGCLQGTLSITLIPDTCIHFICYEIKKHRIKSVHPDVIYMQVQSESNVRSGVDGSTAVDPLQTLCLVKSASEGEASSVTVQNNLWLAPRNLKPGMVVCDNGRNLVVALQLGSLTHVPCLVHMFNLVVQQLLKTYPNLGDLLTKVDEDSRQAVVSSNLTITRVTEFIIFGFPSLQQYQLLLFCVFLLIYLFTITGNGSIFLLVVLDRRLHTPMYVFVSNLSLLDLSYATVTIPKMLAKFSMNLDTISYKACLAQMYIFESLTATECLLLTAMAYDRYVAICSPLHYPTIMTKRRYLLLIAMVWVGGFAIAATTSILALNILFCGPNIIHHYYCDHPPLLQLACSDTSLNIVVGSAIGAVTLLMSFTLIVISYIKIILTILKINSKEGRMKTFSTCGSHFAVVSIFYLPLTIIYIRPSASSDVDSLVALLYTVLTPVMNPIIYSLRNKDIIEAFKKKIHFIIKE